MVKHDKASGFLISRLRHIRLPWVTSYQIINSDPWLDAALQNVFRKIQPPKPKKNFQNSTKKPAFCWLPSQKFRAFFHMFFDSKVGLLMSPKPHLQSLQRIVAVGRLLHLSAVGIGPAEKSKGDFFGMGPFSGKKHEKTVKTLENFWETFGKARFFLTCDMLKK